MKTSRLLLVGYFAFITLGINVSLLGPSLQTLATKTGSTIPQLGYIFGAMSLGYLVSAPVIASIGAKVSLRPLLSATALILVSLFIFIEGTQLWHMLTAAFLMGFGQSSAQVGFTTLIGTRLTEGRDASAQINRVNAFYGVGALVGPVLASFSYRLTGESISAFWVAFALDVALLAIGLLMPLQRPAGGAARPAAAPVSSGVILRSPVVLGLVMVMIVYVGAEVAFSSWTTEFTRLSINTEIALASLASSAFFLGIALSRYFANVLLRRVSPVRLLFIAVCGAAVGVLAMLVPAQSLVLALSGSMLVGLGYGPVYPTLISLAIARFPDSARTVSSVLTSSGSIGAVVIPSLTGLVIGLPNGLAIAWGMQLALIGGMLLVLLSLRRALAASGHAN